MRRGFLFFIILSIIFCAPCLAYDWSTNPGDGSPENPYQIITPELLNVNTQNDYIQFTNTFTEPNNVILVPQQYETIQAGIDAANDGDIVIVARGVYIGSGNYNIDFKGKAIIVRSEAGPENCILDCEAGRVDRYASGFQLESGETEDSVIDGFTITNGYNYGYAGGIVLRNSSSPTIQNCIITNCGSTTRGGGITALGCAPRIINCVIKNNYGKVGGGIYDCDGEISNCIISNNTARGGGGLYRCDGEIKNCTIRENICPEYGSGGGGLFVCNGLIANCRIEKNEVGNRGGGLGICDGNIINCIIAGNIAGDTGGAFSDCLGKISGCTIVNNQATLGNSIYTASGQTTIKNSIIWSKENREIYCEDGGSVFIEYCNIYGGWQGEGNINTDPLFVDTSDNDYHIMPDSPCINAGDPNYAASDREMDIDQENRVISDCIDMGADEINTIDNYLIASTRHISVIVKNNQQVLDTYPLGLRLSHGGKPDLTIEFISPPSWLTINPYFCQSNEGVIMDLVFSISEMSPGFYQTELKVSENSAVNIPITITVELYIGKTISVPSTYSTIQDAIDAALDGDTIVLADAIYSGDGNRDLDFKGKAITLQSENGPENCIIDCQGAETTLHRGFSFINHETPDSTLKGITIINGFGDNGGAVKLDNSSPSIIDCILRNNTCIGHGGAIFGINESKPVIYNCFVLENTAQRYGGGIYGCYGEINNCIISNNTAYKDGGGLFNSRGIVKKCVINNNVTFEKGGGIRSCDGLMEDCVISGNTGEGIMNGLGTIRNCEISNNSGRGLRRFNGTIEYSRIHSNQEGGLYECDGLISHCEIYNNVGDGGGGLWECNGTIEYCKVFENKAKHGAGIGYCKGLITGCEIVGNTATIQGGGVLNSRDLRNSIIASNIAPQGAGVYTGYGLISNCTIVSNVADKFGSGVANASMRPTLQVINTIIRDNIPDEIYIGEDAFPPIPFTYCNIEGGWEGTGNIDVDPLFVDLNYGDFHLLSDSLCINAGDPNFIPGPNETDLDGNPRIKGLIVDMGAYEFNHQPTGIARDIIAYAWIDGLAEVSLDGMGSYDADGDVLEYYWFDANELIATGAEPNVVLGVGEHVIELIVNDGIEDSEPNACIVTVIGAMETEAKILPQMINTNSNRGQMMGRLVFEGELPPELDVEQPMLLLVGGCEIEANDERLVYSEEEMCWYLMGFFESTAVMDGLPAGDEASLTLVSRFGYGQWIHGADTVKVKH